MKRIVIVCGLISGAITSGMMVTGMMSCYGNPNYEASMIVGFASMILAFSLIFVGVKIYRDKHNGGEVSFGKAFAIGLYISLIASTMYVVSWAILYNTYMPDFMDKYSAHMVEAIKAKGGDSEKIAAGIKRAKEYKEMYKSPLMFTFMTYTEILPVGLLMSLISAAILRRKKKVIDVART